MSAVTTPALPATDKPRTGGPGSGGGYGSGGDGDRGGPRQPRRRPTHLLGMCLGLAGVAMLFLGLTSAYIVREQLGGQFPEIDMPPLLLLNTILLVASSLTLEKTRRAIPAPQGAGQLEVRTGYTTWLMTTLGLGVLFLLGQLVAWQQLSGQGIYLGTNPHSSFFYTLTGLHALHLLGGVVALGYLAVRHADLTLPLLKRRTQAIAIYWHFMDGLWLYLLLLLFVWK